MGSDAMGTVRDEMRAELARYQQTCEWWSALGVRAEVTGEPESITDCQRYDDKMREHASVFAHLASVLLRDGDQAPAYPGAALVADRSEPPVGIPADFPLAPWVAEPLGPVNPADGELPDESLCYGVNFGTDGRCGECTEYPENHPASNA